MILNAKNRPCIRLPKLDDIQHDSVNKGIINDKVQDFNNGLLLDLAIHGSRTKWQLLQMLLQIKSHQSTDNSSVENKKLFENGGYHRLTGLNQFVAQLYESLPRNEEQEEDTYATMEMKGFIDIQDYTRTQKWLGKLQVLIKLLLFNLTDAIDFQSTNSGTHTRWEYLDNLTKFIKSTLQSPDKSQLPYK